MALIEEITSKLPKTEKALENNFNNCKSRQKFIKVDNSEFKKYLEKAKSDLKSVRNDYRNKFWDWVIIRYRKMEKSE